MASSLHFSPPTPCLLAVVRVSNLATELRQTAADALSSFTASLVSQGVSGPEAEEATRAFQTVVDGALGEALAGVTARGAEVVATAVSVCMQVG
jgi:hypothetical protein